MLAQGWRLTGRAPGARVTAEMPCALAIDFGEKRIGLALSDPEGRVAVPLPTLERADDRSAVEAIAAIVQREGVELLIVGEPRNLDGSRGESAARVAGFARKLERSTGLPPRLIDEALTSREAEARLRESGVDPRAHPERVDALAAQLLLQEALGLIE